MTPEQYETYQKMSKEIQPVKDFLECGCGLMRNKHTNQFPFSLIIRKRHEKKMFFRRHWYVFGQSENEFEIPKSLQFELAATAERWLKQHEDLLQNI